MEGHIYSWHDCSLLVHLFSMHSPSNPLNFNRSFTILEEHLGSPYLSNQFGLIISRKLTNATHTQGHILDLIITNINDNIATPLIYSESNQLLLISVNELYCHKCCMHLYVHYFSSKGTGFIGFIRIDGNPQYVLVTCNHVVPTEEDAQESQFYFNYLDAGHDPLPYEASKILDMTGTWFWFDQDYYDSVCC